MSMRSAVPLGLLLLAIAPLQAMGSAPIVYADQGPMGGKLFFDPILTWNVAYSEPGYTDCNVPEFNICHLHGPGQAARFIRVVVEGKGSASLSLINEETHMELVNPSTCGSTGAFAQCVFLLPRDMSSTDFHLQVYRTDGLLAGTTIAVYLESGTSLFEQML